jgi:dynein heavy chain 1
MEVASTGVPNGVSTPDTAALVDSGAVIQYLTEVLQVTLGALKSELETAGSLLSEARYNETVQRCTRFASESQVALYVQKDIAGAEETNGENEGPGESSPSATLGNTVGIYADQI